jgi:DNA-binding NtrC family response regulator
MIGSQLLHHRVRVLAVDDDLAMRAALLGALDATRFDVVVAEGIHASLALLVRQHFDIVVCGSPDTAAALREKLELVAVPVVTMRPLDAESIRRAVLEVVVPTRRVS